MTSVDYNLELRRLRDNGWVPLVKPPKLLDTDLPRIGHRIRVGEDEIHAVLDVEARAGGYDSKGRLLPLYEPHVAYRCASGAVRDRLVKAGIAWKSWKRDYPKDSYPRFEQAFAIDPEVAIKACSWGRGQILGENFAMCGYDSPQEMYVRLANGGEVEHLEAMVSFIIAAKLDDELRNHNWAGFARGYNGPSYAKNGYDTKLAQRFAVWKKIPDTPWDPSMIVDDHRPPAPGEELELPPLPGTVVSSPALEPKETVLESVPVAPLPLPESAPEPVPDPAPVVPEEPLRPVETVPAPAAPAPMPGTKPEPITAPPVTTPRKTGFGQWLRDLIDSIFFTRPGT